jgi:outer membrane protein assembly factor BamB
MQPHPDYKNIFDTYIKTVFSIQDDIRFWIHFLNTAIENYKKENPVNRWISQSGFYIYNVSPNPNDTWLNSSTEKITIEINDLTNQSSNFCNWIMNMSVQAIASNGIVYVGGGGTHYIYAFDAGTGNTIWKFEVGFGGLATSSPCLIDKNGAIVNPGNSN